MAFWSRVPVTTILQCQTQESPFSPLSSSVHLNLRSQQEPAPIWPLWPPGVTAQGRHPHLGQDQPCTWPDSGLGVPKLGTTS